MSLPDNDHPIKRLEFQLLGWRKQEEDHKSVKPPTVTFALESDGDIEFFQNYTTKKGKIAGQLFIASMQISPNDDQSKEPVSKTKKPQTLSQRAALICMNQNFWKYLKEAIKITTPCNNYKEADAIFKGLINIKSKAELDNDSRAIAAFKILEKGYREWANR